MRVDVLFFGATAAVTGERRISVEAAAGSTAKLMFEEVLQRYPALGKHKLHFSIDQTYATGDEIIRDGDEIAIFTAVSGG